MRGSASQQPAMLVRRDHVIRRRDHLRQVVDQLAGVAERAKRTDRRHGPESYDSPRCRPGIGGRGPPRNFSGARGVVEVGRRLPEPARPPLRMLEEDACRIGRSGSASPAPVAMPRSASSCSWRSCPRGGPFALTGSAARRADDERAAPPPGPRPRRDMGGRPGRPPERRARDLAASCGWTAARRRTPVTRWP